VIGHTHINNSFFKLVEVLLQIHSCFFSHSIKLRGLITAISSHCLLTALPAKMSAFNSHMQQNAYWVLP